jgi:deoxyribodipyrimidine photo-lyase
MTRGLHWFRNDMRLRDNTALLALCDRVEQWLPVFVLDPRLLHGDPSPRARFLLDCLQRLSGDLAGRGIPLVVRTGRPEKVLPQLVRETGADWLSFNEASTPFGRNRDATVQRAIERSGTRVLRHRDHVVFGSDEIRTQNGGSYSIYTPYRKTWWRTWVEEPRVTAPSRRLPAPIPGFKADLIPGTPAAEGHPKLPAGGERAAQRRLRTFLTGPAGRDHEDRDRPDRDGTSRLSPYLRFGVISARQCFEHGVQAAADEPKLRRGVGQWLDELVWREFYVGILEQHPRVLRESFRRDTQAVVWNDDAVAFESWCAGRTGFPIVDAGMRQLLTTGWVHNRVRLIVASFLTKDLLIDWREGERFFFQHLVDGDPASNNGGWQWAASTGTDAQPYFRIFNPVSQGQRFDPDGSYVRRFVPELSRLSNEFIHEPWKAPTPPSDYPPPVVDHAERRLLALARFRSARARAYSA